MDRVPGRLWPSQAEPPPSREDKGERQSLLEGQPCPVPQGGPEPLSKPLWASFSFGETGSQAGELLPSSKNAAQGRGGAGLKVSPCGPSGSEAQGRHQPHQETRPTCASSAPSPGLQGDPGTDSSEARKSPQTPFSVPPARTLKHFPATRRSGASPVPTHRLPSRPPPAAGPFL